MYLVGTEEEINIANTQIESNAGIPYGNTVRWAVPTQAYEQNFWFIPMPNPNAIYNGHTGEELMQNVINVAEEEFNPNWFPPQPEQPG